jgi:hypothetical protein
VANESLESLQQGSPDALESLVETEPNKGHAPSSKNRAAYVSMMSEGEPVETFRQIEAEMSQLGNSPTAQSLSDDAKAELFASNKAAMIEFLADPNFSDEQKRSAALQMLDRTNTLYSVENIFSGKGLAEGSKGENLEQEMVRLSVSDRIDKINQYKKDVQYLLVSEIAQSDTSKIGAWLDFVELILPFDEQARVNNVRNAIVAGEEYRGELDGLFSFLGKSKTGMRDMIENAPVEKRYEMAQTLVNAINDENRLVLLGENELARFEMLQTFLKDGYYGGPDEFVDNVISLLDAVGVGALLEAPLKSAGKRVGKFLKGTRAFSDEEFVSAWRRRNTTKTAQPVSPAENMVETNPERSRLVHEASAQDAGGEAAEAFYGTTREDAMAGDLLVEALTADQRMRKRTHNVDAINNQEITPRAEILDVAAKDGGIYYFEAEKKQMRSAVYNDFESAAGLRMLHEMSQFGVADDGGYVIRAVYGAPEGGFLTAQRAVDQAKFNLRKYGIVDRDITVMKRGENGEYAPVEGVPTEVGDYIAKVDYTYKFNPLDIQKWSEADVKYNIFDRIPWGTAEAKAGTLQRNLLDAHSMLHPKLTLGANVSVDKAAGLESNLLDFAKEFSDKYTKFPKDRQALLDDYIRESNYRGVPLKESKLLAEGFTKEEIGTLKTWRQYWDTMYWLENKDLAKTLRSRGFEVLEDARTDTRLFARRLSGQSAKGVRTVYDTENGTVTRLTVDQVDEIYEGSGVVAQLRNPLDVDGELIEHIVVKENVEGARLRGIRDFDKILNYRNGYYTVNYTAPKFIVKRVVDRNGKEYTRAVGVAGDTPQAKAYMEALQANADEGAEYFVRGDIKKLDMSSDDYWNIQSASGRVAQRVRGKRLEDGSELAVAGGDSSFVMGPVDSMIHSARSTASRVHMRDYIEATKQRFLKQFEPVLSQEKGFTQWPANLDVIRRNAVTRGIDKKVMADAVTTYEYIRYLEHGYINAIDDGIKASLKALAEISGHKGYGKLERGLETLADKRGVMATAKNAAFQAYLATNPVRQLIVQSHQATLLAVNFPKYVLKQQMARDLGGVLSGMVDKDFKASSVLAGRTPAELETLVKEFKESGLMASVDKQNLVEGSLTQLADDTSKFGKTLAGRAVASGLVFMRKTGFDAGETINILSSWLAHRDQLVNSKGSFKLTQEELEIVSAKARNYTYNMNFAGDLPYNQNALNLMFLYMQVPHKAFTTMTTNRVLSRAEKARMAAYQIPMFTLPPAAMYNIFGEELSHLPEETREMVVQGLEGYMFNKIMSLMIDEPTKTDFSSLAPLDMYGTWEFVEALATLDLGKMAVESPSGQLFFGNNPRITNAFTNVARYFNWVQDFEDPTDMAMVLNGFAEISSGYSNAFRARYAFKHGQIVHGGDVIDNHVTVMEAVLKAGGFPTMDETLHWYQITEGYEKSKEFKTDVRQWYKDLKIHLLKKDPNFSLDSV